MRIRPGMEIPDKKPTPVDERYKAEYPNESKFQKAVERNFKVALEKIADPFLCYHTWRSTNSAPGFPDLMCTHEEAGITLFAELKTETGKVSDTQKTWLQALAADESNYVYLWFPSDWDEINFLFAEVISTILTKRRDA